MELSDSLHPCITVVSVWFTVRTWLRWTSQMQGLPGPAHDVSVHARGLRPRQVRVRLAVAACPLLPSACSERVGTQVGHFGALYPACTFPCQRFTDPVTKACA